MWCLSSTSSSCCHCPTSLELLKDRIFPSLMMLLPFWATVMCVGLCSRLSHQSLDVMLSAGLNHFGRTPLSFSITPCFVKPFIMEWKNRCSKMQLQISSSLVHLCNRMSVPCVQHLIKWYLRHQAGWGVIQFRSDNVDTGTGDIMS